AGVCASAVSAQVGAADLHLDDLVPAVEEAPHLVLQVLQGLAGCVVAAGGVDEAVLVRGAVTVVVGAPPVQRHPRGLGDEVVQGHVHHSDGDGAFAVAAGLFVAHHDVPGPGG